MGEKITCTMIFPCDPIAFKFVSNDVCWSCGMSVGHEGPITRSLTRWQALVRIKDAMIECCCSPVILLNTQVVLDGRESWKDEVLVGMEGWWGLDDWDIPKCWTSFKEAVAMEAGSWIIETQWCKVWLWRKASSGRNSVIILPFPMGSGKEDLVSRMVVIDMKCMLSWRIPSPKVEF